MKSARTKMTFDHANNNEVNLLLPNVTFTMPTYNASFFLRKCLNSIRRQNYPKEKIEIIVADGGSTDDTVEIAKEFGAKVFPNPRKLAEFGVPIAIQNATGDLLVSLAADNELFSDDWIKRIVQPFLEDERVCAAWCRLISGEEDSRINKYYELIQNDPFTFFMNQNLDKYLKVAENRQSFFSQYSVFEVNKGRPLPWGANGITYRTNIIQKIWKVGEYLGDNDAFQIMIEGGENRVAYITSLYVYHHTIGSLTHWVGKIKRNFVDHFLTKRKTRNLNWVFVENFKIKLMLWLVYSLTPIFPLTYAIYRTIRDRNFYWLYHPLMCFIQSLIYMRLILFTRHGRKMIKNFAIEIFT